MFIMIGVIGLAVEAKAQGGSSVTVRIGREKTTARGAVRIRFVEMVQDSRCPRDVQCIQAGNASVRIRVSRNGRSEVLVLNTNRPSDKTTFAGYVFALTALTPEPASNIRINRSGYVATITITRT